MTKRTWLITGTNSGFGRHMTEQLLERGDRVAGTVRDAVAMGGLKEQYGDRLWLARLDVADMPAIRAVVAEAASHARRIIEEAKQPSLGDPAKMAAVIIANADRHPAPKRIVLGSDAYGAVRRALAERLASLEAQEELAYSNGFSRLSVSGLAFDRPCLTTDWQRRGGNAQVVSGVRFSRNSPGCRDACFAQGGGTMGITVPARAGANPEGR